MFPDLRCHIMYQNLIEDTKKIIYWCLNVWEKNEVFVTNTETITERMFIDSLVKKCNF